MNLSLAEAIFWIAALACVVAQLALLRSSFSKNVDTRSDLVPSSPRGIELAWAVLPAIALSVLLFSTWRRVYEPDEHLHMDHSTTTASSDATSRSFPAR